MRERNPGKKRNEPTGCGNGSPPEVDACCIRQRFEGRLDILREISCLLSQEGPELLDQIDRAASAGDFPCVRAAVHGLLNDVGVLGTHPLIPRLRQIQTAAREEDLEEIRKYSASISGDVLRLISTVREAAES